MGASSDPVSEENTKRVSGGRAGMAAGMCVRTRYKDATLRKRRTRMMTAAARRSQTHNPELLKTQ